MLPFYPRLGELLTDLINPNTLFNKQEAGVETSPVVPNSSDNTGTTTVNPGSDSSAGVTLDTGLIQRLSANPTPTVEPEPVRREQDFNIKAEKHFRIYVSKDRYFEMDMLPAIRQNLSHPHGLSGQSVPGAPPGVTFTQLQNTANIPIPGGAPVVQSLGVNMMTMQFVGAFIGLPRSTQGSDAYWRLEGRDDFDCVLHKTAGERTFYDDPTGKIGNRYPGRGILNKGDESWHASYIFSRDVVAEQKEVKVSIFTQNYLAIQEVGIITQFVPMLARNDRVYYKFTLLITDYYNEVHPRIPKSYVKNVFTLANNSSVASSTNSTQPLERPISPKLSSPLQRPLSPKLSSPLPRPISPELRPPLPRPLSPELRPPLPRPLSPELSSSTPF
jgi:hypothetical protein